MAYRGHVRNNVIVLEGGVSLPEGSEVLVEPVQPGPEDAGKEPLFERLADLVGSAEGLPEGLAENHDHYIHGTPKR